MRVMIAVSHQGAKNIIQGLLGSLRDIDVVEPESTTRKAVTEEVSGDIFDFIIMDYQSDVVDGREIYKRIREESRCLETYVMMLVSDRPKAKARTDLKTYLSTPEIGKSIEFLESSDLTSIRNIPERVTELSRPESRRSLAMNGVYITPSDSQVVLTFSLSGLSRLQSINGSLKAYDSLRRDIRVTGLIEQLVKDHGGYMNTENFATEIPIQAIFAQIGKAILAWSKIRNYSTLTHCACAIVEGPTKKVSDGSRRPVLYGHIFGQASRLLEIAMKSGVTLIAIESHFSVDRLADEFRFGCWEDIFEGYKIYELL